MTEIIVTTAALMSFSNSAAVDRAVSEAMQKRQLPIILSIQAAADLLGVSYMTIYRATKIKGFPVTIDFGHTKIITDLLLDWIKSRSNYDLL